jgi:hypothetical protein
MLQVGDGLDLEQESLGADDGRQFGPEHFDRHPAPMLEILGQVHRGHAALPQLPLDAVAVGQRCPQAVGDTGHRTPSTVNSDERYSSTT